MSSVATADRELERKILRAYWREEEWRVQNHLLRPNDLDEVCERIAKAQAASVHGGTEQSNSESHQTRQTRKHRT
jgi:hypothetical protein